MAQFTVGSKDIMASLISLKKNVVDAIGWVSRNPRRMRIDVPDCLWRRLPAGRELGVRSVFDCESGPKLTSCQREVISPERAKVEILLNVAKKMGGKGKVGRRPKARRK